MRSNLFLVPVVSAVGALLCAYLSSLFLPLLEGEDPQKSCSVDPTRRDRFAFIVLISLDIYVGPNVLSLALAVALLARLCAERRAREHLFNFGRHTALLHIRILLMT